MIDAARAAGALLLLGLSACVPPAKAPPPPSPVAPPPAVERATEPPERAEFAFEGAMVQGGVVLGTAPSGTVSLRFDGETIPVARDGRFLIAFDRDASRQASLLATLADGRTVAKRLSVADRAWDIEHVDIPRGVSRPDPDYQRIRAAELRQINAARAQESDVDGWRQRFLWPATGRLSGVFGSQRIYRGGEAGAYHSGVDIATGESGTPVVSPADGVVVLATEKPFSLEGNLLIVDHGQGLNSAFLHLSRIDVREGQRVKRGQLLGAIGSTGRATGPHLHWSMKWRSARIDPELLAGPMPGYPERPGRIATDDGRQ